MAEKNDGIFDKIKDAFEDGKDKVEKDGDSLIDKVKGMFGDEKKSDELLDKASNAAKKATGGKFDDKIDQARNEADKHLGDE